MAKNRKGRNGNPYNHSFSEAWHDMVYAEIMQVMEEYLKRNPDVRQKMRQTFVNMLEGMVEYLKKGDSAKENGN